MSKKALLDKIIADVPEGHQATVQLLLQGQLLMGVISRSEEYPEKMYVLLTAVQVQGKAGTGVWFFEAEDVGGIMAFHPEESAGIFTPGGNRTPSGIVT